MFKENKLIAYGPVPSRRLGQSLGINNIPPKVCTYSCVYCQIGRTSQLQISREDFYSPKKIFNLVEKKVKDTKLKEEYIDYLTFASDGEPTLDRNIGEEIELLKSLGIRIAVLTNASLLWKKEVRSDLKSADLVSVKIDTVNEEIWQEINRPHGSLHLKKILDGIIKFSKEYRGELITESMIIKSMIFRPEEIERTANFIVRINPEICYLTVPIRPPAEDWVRSPTEFELFNAYLLFLQKGINVEYLSGYEGNAFICTGNVEEDLLGITAVHPMREDEVKEYLKNAHKSWKVIETLVHDGKLKETIYGSSKFYVGDLLHKYKN
ncbi:MAG: radical SAM protein [Spirochaetota bacterium]|nr:MAG: radical SAM protein [Spirochaetota bacterium]